MKSLTIWILQTGEPLHIDGEHVRPMRAMNLTNALVQAGHKVILWSSVFYHQEKRQRSMTQQKIRISNRLEIRLIPSCGYRRNIGLKRFVDHAQMAFNLKKMLKRVTVLPDVGFIGYPPIEPAGVMVRWLSVRSIPTMLDVKDQWPSFFLQAFPSFIRPFGRLILWPYYQLSKRAMKNVTCISSMANDFLTWALNFVGRERTKKDGIFPLTTPLGQVSSAQMNEARQWWNERGIFDDGRARIYFVGSLSPAFDFIPVWEAAKHVLTDKNLCEFVICGDGSSANELKTMMATLPNVHFSGWIDRPKIEALAERSMAALAPYINIDNYTKNIPNKIIDALLLGLPILTPLQGEVALLLEKYGVGIRYGTYPGKSLYDCIQILMQDPDLQKSMSLRARALYKERFSFEMVYGGLVKHLEKMASGRWGNRYN